MAPPPALPDNFIEVLEKWGHTWVWKEMKISNASGVGMRLYSSDDFELIRQAIREGSLMCVSDDSYIKQVCPHLCSAAVIMQCSQGRGRLVLSFPERSKNANAYRGELLGLLCIHLLLLSFNTTWPGLKGKVDIYSDCLGALNKVRNLPPHCIPSRCKHSDVLKTIMANCGNLLFDRYFSHVEAHQDNHKGWDTMDRPAQLNSGCDAAAKQQNIATSLATPQPQLPFPLEPVTLYVNGDKLTSDSGTLIRFEAHRQEARQVLHQQKVLDPAQFDLVAWEYVYKALHDVPKMFAIFACKQVFDISATNYFLAKRDETITNSPLCPCCEQGPETAGHILRCSEEGLVKMLRRAGDGLMDWLLEVQTPRDLVYLIGAFVQNRGYVSMEELCHQLPPEYLHFARAQDSIGWRRFLEGMIAAELETLLLQTGLGADSPLGIGQWMTILVKKLLEVTHSMWMFCNLSIHDPTTCILATQRKERIMDEVEYQQELGGRDLREEDQWLLEVNLDDLEHSNGEREAYWVLAVETAREHHRILQQRSAMGQPQQQRTT
jgi:hypothetical protein